MSLPKWIEEIKQRKREPYWNCGEPKLIEALSIAVEALEKFKDDESGNRANCDFHLQHDQHGWATDALRRLEEMGK
jgi:hypothetical protein